MALPHRLLLAVLLGNVLCACTAEGQASHLIHAMDGRSGVVFASGEPTVVPGGPAGERVLLFEGQQRGGATGREDAAFSAEIDLGTTDLSSYDVLKLEANASRGATLLLAVDNFPEPGLQARWYVLDALRGPTGWRTFIVDLRLPEEIRGSAQAGGQRILLSGRVKDSGRAMQGDERRILVGPLRAVKKAVDVDWDQSRFTISGGDDLVYTYPLTVTNTNDRPIEAQLRLEPFQVARAGARVIPDRVRLEPGEQIEVKAEITLPDVSSHEPLYTERFEIWVRAAGIADSDMSIVRSADVIHLPVVVPLPESTLQFPLLPPPDELPADVLQFDPALARSVATARPASELIEYARRHGIYNYREGADSGDFRRTLVSAAYLFRLTGEEQYLSIARALINALPGIWKEQARQYDREVEHPLISSGVIVRMGEGWHYTLGLGWRLTGTQRSPYYYGTSGNGAGGGMNGIFYVFDMLAPHLTDAERATFIDDFAVPAGIRARNHYVGDGNQQSTVNAVSLYAGLASRNWPLVAFATSSEHGFHNILEWTQTDEGMHVRNGYQTYSLRPMFFNAELLYHRGINPYETYFSRLESFVNWSGRRPFDDRYFWDFVLRERDVAARPVPAPTALSAEADADGTLLRWQDESSNEAWFVVERRDHATGSFEEIGRSPAGWSAFRDTSPADAQYSYRVRAFNYRSGFSASSNTANAPTR